MAERRRLVLLACARVVAGVIPGSPFYPVVVMARPTLGNAKRA